ncbi:hypothetical protein VCRA2114E5_30051 [Vibrio crassostreae]|nr:hypothetical protein VCRA2114E5_30051 [Vibrio crassostreae]CAK2948677.1 hypothetical protein VCRA2110O2_60050 [Vibrio crassostreae]CAK2996260.1 hypothetical protein VCRA2122O10_60051 [Vibrio crassostreae]CAK3619375.1 hypothetical protein VCRA2126E14_50049 [Vibrio crassostreae]
MFLKGFLKLVYDINLPKSEQIIDFKQAQHSALKAFNID